MKLFKIEKRNSETGSDEFGIIEIPKNDITDIVNSFGMWIQSSRFELDETNFELNEDGTFNLTEDYNEQDNLKLLPSTFDLRKLSKNEMDVLIELSRFSIDNSDEANSTTVYCLEILPIHVLVVKEIEPIVVGKEYKFWNGHNWKQMILSHDGLDLEIVDVTDEYVNWDAKEKFFTSKVKKKKNGTNFSFHSLMLDNKMVLVKEEKTNWQGGFDTFLVITDVEEIEILLAKFVDDEIIKENFPLIFEKYA